MVNIQKIVQRLGYEISAIKEVVLSPKSFVREARFCQVNGIKIGLILLWSFLFNMDKVLQKGAIEVGIGTLSSIGVLWIYFLATILLIGGKPNKGVTFNLALYTHIFYILINASYGNKVMMLLVFTISHHYNLRLHYYTLIKVLKCDRTKVRRLLTIELCIIGIGFLDIFLALAEYYMLYSTKIMYYPLIG